MPRAKTDVSIEVPDCCFVVKNRFYEQPSLTRVKEWKETIALTGQPHMLNDHTHTKPPPGSAPKYLDTFDLPEKQRKLGYLAPCPCCWPRHRKYGKDGKIAWFPDEGVVRMMGPDCFAALDPEAHAFATAELAARKKRERDVRYLLEYHDRLIRAHDIVKKALPVARAINDLSTKLRKTLNQTLNLPLWDQLKRGELLLPQSVNELDANTGEIRSMVRDIIYSRVAGFKMLKPELKDYSLNLRQCLSPLAMVAETDDWKAYVEELSERDRDDLAKIISGAIKRAKDLLRDMRELQRFVAPVNVNTLRAWSQKEGCSLPIFVYRKGDVLVLARGPTTARVPLVMPACFEDEIGEIDAPMITDTLVRSI